MAFKWSAIEAFEKHNSRREWFDGEGKFYASVTLMCDWEWRFALAQDLYTSQLGAVTAPAIGGYNPRVWPDPGGTGFIPDAPTFSGPLLDKIGVTSVQIRTWEEAGNAKDANGQVFNYRTTAFLDVQYGRLYNIEESIEFDAETVTQSFLSFRWKDITSIPKDLGYIHELEVPAVTLHSGILTRDFIGLAPGDAQSVTQRPNLATIFDCVGRTNSKAYHSVQCGITFEAGTLMMLEPEVRASTNMQGVFPNVFGDKGFSVTVKFLYKPGDKNVAANRVDTHNLFWRPSRPIGGSVTDDRGNWDRLLIPDPDEPRGNWKEYTPFKRSADIDQHWLLPANKPFPVN